MTPKQALETLLSIRRLRFGAGDQIEALSILRMAEELIETPRVCPNCDGEGETDEAGYCANCGRECEHCGHGSETCHDCKGTGQIEWTRDDVYRLSAESIVKLLSQAKAA